MKQALDAVAKERLPAIVRGFKPGNGLRAVREAGDDIPLALVRALFAHEPWDEIDHDLLEPLFDAARVLARIPAKSPKVPNKIEEANVVVRRGDVSIKGDLMNRGVLIVTGSLRVSGALHAYGEEWSSGTTIVLGDVHAARALVLGPCAIGGTLTAKQGLFTEYYHDTSSSLVASKIVAPIWFDRGDIAGRVRAKLDVKHRLRHQAWIPKALPKYFDDSMRKLEWTGYDGAFFRAAVRAADDR